MRDTTLRVLLPKADRFVKTLRGSLPEADAFVKGFFLLNEVKEEGTKFTKKKGRTFCVTYQSSNIFY